MKKKEDKPTNVEFLLIQFLRIGLLMRHILILKRFFTTLRVVLLKSFPIIFLFFIIIFIFGLIGKKVNL